MKKICILGLGYVGLPLAVEFSKSYNVIGFDINKNRIKELNEGKDSTLEIEEEDLKNALNCNLKISNKLEDIQDSNIYIITVPTPVDKNNKPDLNPLSNVSKMIGKVLNKNDIVIYESTTYPGCTRDFCVPLLEEFSDKKMNKDFFVGYSPERINPGDKVHTLTTIKKVTSGSNEKTAKIVDDLYKKIIKAGTHKASSIEVAEASKIIENTQRDINISFVNELALIFDKLNIDTTEVLEAAGTKWNFLNFKPGLVGGHCISIDPYYLANRAEEVGFHPEVILSGRRVNDMMGSHIAHKVIKLMIKNKIQVQNSKVLILGITFKENCPDIRNTKVVDVRKELLDFGCKVDVYDNHASSIEVKKEFDIKLKEKLNKNKYDAIILAVSHENFKNINFNSLKKNKKSIIYDIKSFLNKKIINSRL